MTMKEGKKSGGHHIRNRLFSGLLILVPLGITFGISRIIFFMIAGFLKPLVRLLPWRFSELGLMLVSAAAFVLLVYAIGAITAHVMGRRLLALGEALILRVPVVRTIYSASKQVVDAFSPQGRSTFRGVALVEFPRAGMKTVAFITGTIRSADGERYYKIFVPTAPNPTTGFLQLARPEQVEETDLSVEDGLKMLFSGGVISPETVAMRPSQETGKAAAAPAKA